MAGRLKQFYWSVGQGKCDVLCFQKSTILRIQPTVAGRLKQLFLVSRQGKCDVFCFQKSCLRPCQLALIYSKFDHTFTWLLEQAIKRQLKLKPPIDIPSRQFKAVVNKTYNLC